MAIRARRPVRPDRLDRADPVRRDPQLRAAGARGAQPVPAPARQRQSGHGVVPAGQRTARAAAVAAAEAARRSPADHDRRALVAGAEALLKPRADAPPITILPAGYHSQSQNHAGPPVQASAPLSLAAELPLPHRNRRARRDGGAAWRAFGPACSTPTARCSTCTRRSRGCAPGSASRPTLCPSCGAPSSSSTWLRALMGRHADFWQVTGDALDYALARTGVDPAVREPLMRLSGAGRLPRGAGRAAPAARGRAQDRDSLERRAHDARSRRQGAGIDGLLDAILSVEEVGVFKPHPKVYQLAVDRLGVPGDQIAFQSSNAWDVAAPRPLACARYGSTGSACRRSACPVGRARARDLSGLPALLGL